MTAPVPVDTAADPGLRRVLAQVLGRAFAGDPHINWIVRQDAHHLEARGRLFDLLLSDLLGRQGRVLASPDLKAAAIWYPPHGHPFDLVQQARVAWRFAGITGWGAWPVRAYGLNRMAWRHPRAPHFFLQTLGVDPEYQGRGHGSALLAAFTRLCDARPAPAYLETSRPENLAFYARHGFRTIGQARLPGGPVLWRLWRPPVDSPLAGERDSWPTATIARTLPQEGLPPTRQ